MAFKSNAIFLSGGYVECYLDSLQGPLLGKSQWVEVVEARKRVKKAFPYQVNRSKECMIFISFSKTRMLPLINF